MALADANGMSGRSVFRLPSISESQLVSAARAADVGVIPYNPVFPNHVMACPNKLDQYMQAGIAILSNNIPYVRHIIERRSEEHTSELQSLMRISYAVFCLKIQT